MLMVGSFICDLVKSEVQTYSPYKVPLYETHPNATEKQGLLQGGLQISTIDGW